TPLVRNACGTTSRNPEPGCAAPRRLRPGAVAQWSEQRTHNPSDGGSTPPGPTVPSCTNVERGRRGDFAQPPCKRIANGRPRATAASYPDPPSPPARDYRGGPNPYCGSGWLNHPWDLSRTRRRRCTDRRSCAPVDW